jgi:hypothetical protein
MTYLKGLTEIPYLKGLTEAELEALDKEATAYLLEKSKYAAPADHPILGASLINTKNLPKGYTSNKRPKG